MSDQADLNKRDENTQAATSEQVGSGQPEDSISDGNLNMNSGDEIRSDSSFRKSTVAVSGKDRINKWFYIMFGITLIVFIFLTSLILKINILPFSLSMKNQPAPTPVVTSVMQTSPSPTIFVETDPAVLQLNKLSESDNIVDLENDLKDTDLKPIEESIKNLDGEMDFNPQ